jgi:hypothetical protein
MCRRRQPKPINLTGDYMSKKLLIFSFIFLFFSISVKAADPTPAWLSEAARLPTPAFEIKNVPAVILHNEENISITSEGKITRTNRFAVRVLIREGREEAIARVVYQTDGEKVRDIKGWLIRANGQTKDYGKKETIDVAAVSNDLYNEARIKLIDATDDTDAGDVFGYETITEERGIFSQFSFQFQERLPVLKSRCTLNLPEGWKAESVTFNHPKVEPTVSGSSYSWEINNLQPINYEPSSPRWSSISPRLAISFFPTQATATQIRTFSNWNDVARWMSEVEDPQANINDDIAGKVQELTANAKSELEKIQAIARYVQQIQYISIQVGTKTGGGYRPNLATEVFAKSYGDCKDKANLMRAMLSVVKIPAFMVSITADDPMYVRAEWASPHQFNHCIIAIKVSDDINLPSVVTHPKLGRLLIFDPTDAYTQVGDLPEDQQGSLALIDHKDSDSLLRMPILPPEMSQVERNIEVSLSPEGSISGKVSEKSIGQSASEERGRLRNLSSADYNRMIENWIGRGVNGVKATKIAPKDNVQEGSFNLDVEFGANSYAQLMQGRLMVFKPAIIGRLDRQSFSEGKRIHPYLIDATTYSENVKIKLPEGFIIDEMPEPVQLKADFGKYDVKYEVKDGHLILKRSMTLNKATVSPEKYDSVWKFFGQVRAAEQSPVVLMKK